MARQNNSKKFDEAEVIKKIKEKRRRIIVYCAIAFIGCLAFLYLKWYGIHDLSRPVIEYTFLDFKSDDSLQNILILASNDSGQFLLLSHDKGESFKEFEIADNKNNPYNKLRARFATDSADVFLYGKTGILSFKKIGYDGGNIISQDSINGLEGIEQTIQAPSDTFNTLAKKGPVKKNTPYAPITKEKNNTSKAQPPPADKKSAKKD